MLELLMPAGNLKKLKSAFHFGADAVYLGGKSFSLRAFADNFTLDEIKEGIEFAHSLNKKVYVTVNIFAKNTDIEDAKKYFIFLESVHADAVLISDIGLVSLCKEVAPNLPIHLSTQANTTNKLAVKFWKDYGVKRVVLARELSFNEIKEIHEAVPDIEIEAFVHGAMCMSYSGRCLLSTYFTNRSANRGACIQPCRWAYQIKPIQDEDYPPLEVYEDEKVTYFMNSKDLNLIRKLPELIDSGVISFKVEGRMKSEFYVATVASAYRKALDEFCSLGSIPNIDIYDSELNNVAHRDYTDAYFNGGNLNTVSHENGQIPEKYVFTAVVKEYNNGKAIVEMRNRFKSGDALTILTPNKNNSYKTFIVKDIILMKEGTVTDDAKLVQSLYQIDCDFELLPGDILLK